VIGFCNRDGLFTARYELNIYVKEITFHPDRVNASFITRQTIYA